MSTGDSYGLERRIFPSEGQKLPDWRVYFSEPVFAPDLLVVPLLTVSLCLHPASGNRRAQCLPCRGGHLPGVFCVGSPHHPHAYGKAGYVHERRATALSVMPPCANVLFPVK